MCGGYYMYIMFWSKLVINKLHCCVALPPSGLKRIFSYNMSTVYRLLGLWIEMKTSVYFLALLRSCYYCDWFRKHHKTSWNIYVKQLNVGLFFLQKYFLAKSKLWTVLRVFYNTRTQQRAVEPFQATIDGFVLEDFGICPRDWLANVRLLERGGIRTVGWPKPFLLSQGSRRCICGFIVLVPSEARSIMGQCGITSSKTVLVFLNLMFWVSSRQMWIQCAASRWRQETALALAS